MVCKRYQSRKELKAREQVRAGEIEEYRDFLEPSDMSGNNVLNHKDCLAVDNKGGKDHANGLNTTN